MYYAVQEYGNIARIHYVMIYAYQGGQTVRAIPLVFSGFDCIVNTIGTHQGDLEHVAVTLEKQPSGAFSPISVLYDAHGHETIYPTQRVDWSDGTHPVVHSALNGHSSQNVKVVGYEVSEDRTPGAVDIKSILGEGGVWTPSDFRLLGLDAQKQPIGSQIWAAFSGRLGDTRPNKLESATYLDGGGLSAAHWTFVKTIGWGAGLLGKLDSFKTGAGPGGPGSRDWVFPATAPLIGSGMEVQQAVEFSGAGDAAVAWLAGPGRTIATSMTRAYCGSPR